MVMSDVKGEEVEMAAEHHFSGDWSSISGMKVPGCRGNELVMENMDVNKEKFTAKFARWAKTFSIPYVFYAFALCDPNKGTFHKCFSGICPLTGEGTPPFR